MKGDSERGAPRIKAFLDTLARPVCDALVVIADSQTLVDWRSGRADGPMDTMSMTKSVVSMVIGRLFRERILKDLDVPISRMLPAWRGTPKERITLRQLMSHTSGLDPSPSSEEVFESGDVVEFALNLELVKEPGQEFAYNNAAVNLLSAVVASVAGRPLDRVSDDLLFEPLGIQRWEWRCDAAGTPLVMSGCSLEPDGVAVLGQLMAHDGMWRGRELLSREWCRVSTTPSPPASTADLQQYLRGHALLWWVLYPPDESFTIDREVVHAWRQAEPPMDSAVLERLEELALDSTYDRHGLISAVTGVLRTLTNGDEEAAITLWHDNTWRRGLPDARRVSGSETGFFAQGAMGQHLLVVPGRKFVLVQMVREKPDPAGAAELLEAGMALLQRTPPVRRAAAS